jgi:hypothetical protein
MNAPQNRDERTVINWPAFAVGKPGIDYLPFNHTFTGTVLTWDFATKTPAEVISMAAKVAKHISALEKWLEMAKGLVKGIGEKEVLEPGLSKDYAGEGTTYATVSCRERTGIDTERLKTEFGDAWFASYSKTTEYYEIRFKEAK